MALRFCIVAKVNGSLAGALVAKYLHGVVDYTAIDYGRDQWCLAAADMTAQQAIDLQAQPDAVVFPANLDANLTAGQVTATQTELANRRMPDQWVTTAHTWRDVIRIVGQCSKLLLYFQGRFAKSFWEVGITLATTIAELTQNQRDALREAAAHFGVSDDGVTGATTIRQVLKLFADRMPPLQLAGEVF